MITLLRNRKKIYVCNAKLTPNADTKSTIKEYDNPIELYENCQVTHGTADFERFGLDAYQYARIKTSANHGKYYHLGDAVYVNVTPPKHHDKFCKTADYVVSEDPIITINECEILLRRRSGRK